MSINQKQIQEQIRIIKDSGLDCAALDTAAEILKRLERIETGDRRRAEARDASEAFRKAIR